MDIEQLKMILDMASVAGAGGKEMFYMYLGVSLFKSFCTAVSILFLVFCAYKLILRFISNESDLTKLVEASGVYHCFNKRELNLACAVLRTYYQVEKKKLEDKGEYI